MVLDDLARELYDAVSTSKLGWDQIGDTTKQVWREKAQRKADGCPKWYSVFKPCCPNENRSMNGGCLSCGDPCL